jgi:phage shock protein PspC (stress-responsive transcriptional regulator)
LDFLYILFGFVGFETFFFLMVYFICHFIGNSSFGSKFMKTFLYFYDNM